MSIRHLTLGRDTLNSMSQDVREDMTETRAWMVAEYWYKNDMTITDLQIKLKEIEDNGEEPQGAAIMEKVIEYRKNELLEHD